MKRWLQSGVFVLCVLFSAAGAYNVLSDNGDVEHLAQEVACSGPPAPGSTRERSPGKPAPAGCTASKTMMKRTPVAQTFEFATTTRKQVTVRCARSAVFVGDYACELR